jgi:hypothetical protein
LGFDNRVAIRYVDPMTAHRSHSDIVDAAIGDDTLTALSVRLGGGVSRQNVVDWRRRDFIPAERWTRFVELGVTTLDELATHVAAPPAEQAA